MSEREITRGDLLRMARRLENIAADMQEARTEDWQSKPARPCPACGLHETHPAGCEREDEHFPAP